SELWPERFQNVTNGVTPRRFMVLSNPALAALLNEALGESWMSNLSSLRALETRVADRAFQERWRRVKRINKERLAARIRERTGIVIDPGALFDIQVKRIHEYKRQHLNVLHIITLYNRLGTIRFWTGRRAASSSAARPHPATTWRSSSSG